ncbi:PaaI family thioesterase [Dactylosporangium salmoneum]|uniref:Acyl-coenzyme A thioesterase THEM4 n=1 Tax=Dactylosporangium salmoneum TaxID=53361 RepID=A0ABN3FPQ6_9ACTN
MTVNVEASLTQHDAVVTGLRDFLDALASAAPDERSSQRLLHDLAQWTEDLRQDAVEESHRHYGRSPTLATAGQATTPWYVVDEAAPPERLAGRASFSNFFLGGRGAAHGGTIPLLFDELFGWLANSEGMPPSRTAYLTTNYRSVVRVGRPMTFTAWTDRVEGRKRFLRAELRDGDTVCAESEALFVTLRAGQP